MPRPVGNAFEPDPIPIPVRESIVTVSPDGQVQVDPSTGSPVTRLWARHFHQITTVAQTLQGQGYVLEGTHATRRQIDPNTVPAGSLYNETDRDVLYVAGFTWTYLAGEFVGLREQAPRDLDSTDTGFRMYVSDFGHHVLWNGSAWVFLDAPAGLLAMFTQNPGTGWQVCDGSNTTYLQAADTLSAIPITVPILAAAPSPFYVRR